MDIAELSERVATAEISNGRGDCPEQITMMLHHVHLTKIEQFSVVNYDRDAKTVELNPLPRQFRRLLKFTAEDEVEACTVVV